MVPIERKTGSKNDPPDWAKIQQILLAHSHAYACDITLSNHHTTFSGLFTWCPLFTTITTNHNKQHLQLAGIFPKSGRV